MRYGIGVNSSLLNVKMIFHTSEKTHSWSGQRKDYITMLNMTMMQSAGDSGMPSNK